MAPVRSILLIAGAAVASAFAPPQSARMPRVGPLRSDPSDYGQGHEFGKGAGLMPRENDDPSFETVRLSGALAEADIEKRKDEEAALQREKFAEFNREERLKKIAFMKSMPDDTCV